MAAILVSVRAASTTLAVSSDSKLAAGGVSSTGTVRWRLPGWMCELRACATRQDGWTPVDVGRTWSRWPTRTMRPSADHGVSGQSAVRWLSHTEVYFPFLDEAPEFPARVLEALREPLETGDVTLHRARGVTRYPARFQLVLAANPCPCGKAWGTGKDCSCTPLARRRYLTRLSGPVLDRVDMRLGVGPVDLATAGSVPGEPSAVMAERVRHARERQGARFSDRSFRLNSQIPGPLLRRDFAPARADRRLLERAVETGRLTLRGHDRVLRVAWTLADLDGSELPQAEHIGRALTLRGTEQR